MLNFTYNGISSKLQQETIFASNGAIVAAIRRNGEIQVGARIDVDCKYDYDLKEFVFTPDKEQQNKIENDAIEEKKEAAIKQLLESETYYEDFIKKVHDSFLKLMRREYTSYYGWEFYCNNDGNGKFQTGDADTVGFEISGVIYKFQPYIKRHLDRPRGIDYRSY